MERFRLKFNNVVAALVVSLLATTVAGPEAVGAAPIPLYLNEHRIDLPVPAIMGPGRVLVPLRGYMEALGAQVAWQPPGNITAQLADHSVALTVGSTHAQVDGKPVTLDVPAQLIGDSTYVPVRFLSEGLGASVQYDGSAVRVNLPVTQLVVRDGPLNVRQSPTTAAPVLMTVPTGTLFTVVKSGPEWSQVMLPKGRTGWVATRFTSPVPARHAAPAAAQLLTGPTAYIQVQGKCIGTVPMIDNQLYVPLRPTMAQLGGAVTGTGQQMQARFRNRRVTLPAGSVRQAGDELFVPARTLADGLGLSLKWDHFRRTGELTVPGTDAAGELVCSPGAAMSAYVIMDARSGLILSEQRADVPRKIASTTKIMTALLAVEQGNQESVATVSRFAASMVCTCMGLRAGDRVPLKHLLYGLMLPSGNDAAVAIAEHVSGSEPAFAQLMNGRAAQAGATNTRFVSASGLDDYTNPYSTARDLALIAREAMRNPDFRTLVNAPSYSFYGPRGKQTLWNQNQFILKYPGATGMKSGWTEKAGHTLVTSAHRNGTELIVVMLGAATRQQLYSQSINLMDYGFKLAEASWALK